MLNKQLIFLRVGEDIKALAYENKKLKRQKYLKFLYKKLLKLQTLFKIFLFYVVRNTGIMKIPINLPHQMH